MLASARVFQYPYFMDNDELTAYVTQRLCEADNPGDIILEVCEKTGWLWPKAEEFVNQVQNRKEPEIAKRQFPIMFLLALGIFLAGLGLVAYGVYDIVESWNQLSHAREYIIQGKLPPVDIYSVDISIFLMPIAPLFTGTAMMLGSLLGMREVWYHLLYRE